MKKKNFERLKKSLEQAIAYERDEAEAGRVTMRERLKPSPPKDEEKKTRSRLSA